MNTFQYEGIEKYEKFSKSLNGKQVTWTKYKSNRSSLAGSLRATCNCMFGDLPNPLHLLNGLHLTLNESITISRVEHDLAVIEI